MIENLQQKPGLKLVDLNIEHDKHLDLVLLYLKNVAADVICLQEVFSEDLSIFENELGMHSYFAPMRTLPRNNQDSEPELEGIAILSKTPLSEVRKDYYQTNGREPGDVMIFTKILVNESTQKVLISGVVNTDEGDIRIATTHFTWTPDGVASDQQRHDVKLLINTLSKFEDIIFCGDFNAPRGREIFTQLADIYIDHMPSDIVSTIDPKLHRNKDLTLVVDTIFSSKEYSVSEVEVVKGLSDHCAIVGQISRVTSIIKHSAILNAEDDLVVV